MRNPGESPQEASNRMQKYIRDSLENGDVPAALHAIQDALASGHENFQPYTGRLRDLSFWDHFVPDWFPNPFREWEAYKQSRDLIEEYYRKHGEKVCR